MKYFDVRPFLGAAKPREMMNYFEDYTYFAPNADNMISLARHLPPESFTHFAKWVSQNMTS